MRAIYHVQTYQRKMVYAFRKRVKPRSLQKGDLVLRILRGLVRDPRGKYASRILSDKSKIWKALHQNYYLKELHTWWPVGLLERQISSAQKGEQVQYQEKILHCKC